MTSWTNADKAADLVPLTPAEAAHLAGELFTQRDLLHDGEAKQAARQKDLERVVGIVLETQEHKDVEAAKETLRLAKERALDCPEVAKAKAALDSAKKKLGNVAAHREAKAIAKEVKQLGEVNWELRRAMIDKLTGKRVQYVLPATPQLGAPAQIPATAAPSAKSA